PRLVLLGELVAGSLDVDAGGGELLKQRPGRHLELGCEMFDSGLGHALTLLPRHLLALVADAVSACGSNQWARAFMMRSTARSSLIPVISVNSSVARSASASRVALPFT